MPEKLKTNFSKDLFGCKYRNYSEYLNDVKSQVSMQIDFYKEWFDEDEEMRSIKAQELYNEVDEFILSRVLDNEMFFAIEYLKKAFSLNSFETFLLKLIVFVELDNNIKASVDDLLSKMSCSFGYDFAFKIFYGVDNLYFINDSYNIIKNASEKFSMLCLKENSFLVDDRIREFVLSNAQEPIKTKGVSCYIPSENEKLVANEKFCSQIINFIDRYRDFGETIFFHLRGPKGIGKKTILKRCSQVLDFAVVMLDVSWLNKGDEKEFREIVLSACREQFLNKGVICFYNFDALFVDKTKNDDDFDEYAYMRYINFILDMADKFADIVFILSTAEKYDVEMAGERFFIDIPIPIPDKEESIALWENFLDEVPLNDDLNKAEMSNKFNFTPGQIYGTVREAMNRLLWNEWSELTMRDLCKCAYTQIVHNLDQKATLIETKHTMDQLVLADKEKEMLIDACNQIKYKHVVYDKWGFNKRLLYGRGVSMLFAGPPGTGKTMAAQVVASELGIEIYKVNLSQIVSKYIGETEKNLNTLFDEAKKSNVILFFDETDALLGKRTEVKDSHDKNSNLETSYLLQKMEEYDGITVLSTNYVENIDSAFFRRISYVIHFSFPNVESRKQIWMSIFPKEVPLSSDIDFDYLASQFEIAGGNIKNIAVVAAFLAAQSFEKVSMKHIIKAVDYELTKQGKVLLNEDFGENSYLV